MATSLKQVLLVESEFYARVQLDDDLAPHGFQVTAVKKIRTAMQKLKSQIFHVVIVSYDADLDTPLRLLATLRHNFSPIPVVVLAKRPTEDQLIQLLAYKPVEVLVKPYALLSLVQRMNALIEASGQKS